MAEVGSAFISLVPSAKGFGSATEKQVSGEMGKSGKSIGSKFGSAIKVGALAAVGGAVLVGKFLGDAIGEAREAQVIGARTENVIKSMGNAANISAKQVGNLAGKISLKTGVDDEAIQSGQNLLLTFGNIRNEAGKGNDIFDQTTQMMVDMSAAMGTDAKGSAIQLGKALNDPVKGLTALSRVGVSFTKQQTKQITKLAEGGKTMAAQKIILGELKRQFGGAAAAMATPGDKVAVAWGNVKEQIGTQLLPVVDRLLGVLSGKIIPAVSKFISQMSSGKGTGGQFADVLKQVGAVITGQVIPAVTEIGAKLVVGAAFINRHRTAAIALVATFAALVAITEVYSAVMAVQAAGGLLAMIRATKLVTAVTKTYSAVQWLLNVALTANPIGIVVVAIAALIAGVIIAYQKSETFRGIVDSLFGVLKGLWGVLMDNKQAFLILLGPFGLIIAAVITLYKKSETLRNIMKGAFETIVRGVGMVLRYFGEMLQLIGHVPGMGWVGDLGDKLVAAAGKANDLANNISGIPENKTVNLNVNENWVTTRTVRRGAPGPQLASGGIISRPTLALVGEGRESEAVMPLSRLSAMLDRERSAGAVGGGGTTLRVYDRDNVLLGTMEAVADGRIHGANQLADQTARAM